MVGIGMTRSLAQPLNDHMYWLQTMLLVRAIERAHGITKAEWTAQRPQAYLVAASAARRNASAAATSSAVMSVAGPSNRWMRRSPISGL
jgi:hypothetical protein